MAAASLLVLTVWLLPHAGCGVDTGLILTPSTLNLEETGSAKTYSLQMADTCDPDTEECVGNLLLSNPDGSRQFTFTPDIIRWFANTWTDVKTVRTVSSGARVCDACRSRLHLLVRVPGVGVTRVYRDAGCAATR